LQSQPTEALFAAVQTGIELKNWMKTKRAISDYPATSPLLVLQTAVDTLQETRLEKRGGTGIMRGSIDPIFSLDGRLSVTEESGTTRLRNLQGQELAQFKGHRHVRAGALSPDGQLLATAGHDGTARLWNLQAKS
jgi:WD40 repeat protein